MIWWTFKNYIAISVVHPFKSILKARKYFKVPKLKFYFGKVKDFPLYYFNFGTLFSLGAIDVQWKDKYHTPRHEQNPTFYITLFNVGIMIEYTWGDAFNDLDYWEQVIYTLYYCNGDIKKAEKTWPWQNLDGESTWNNKYIKNI